MKTLADLDLMHLPMEEPGFAADPWPYIADARKHHPWLAKCAFGYVIHSYDAMRDLLWMDDSMQAAQQMIMHLMNGEGTRWGRMVQNGIAALSGEAHTRLRTILAPLFTPKQAKLNRELMQDVMNQLLDQWVPKGAFNFEEFISNFPIGVVCAMIGAGSEDIPRLRSSLETLGLQFAMDPTALPALDAATIEIEDFSKQVAEDRRSGKSPGKGGDLLDVLLQATGEGGMSDQELYDLLFFLFVAGYDTSKNMMTWIMYDLMTRPDMYKRCAEDRDFCDKVIEETFRYHSVATIPRMTTKDIDYRDVVIPAGCMLFFPVSISGRDPEAFANPDAYDPELKRENRHIGFGRGGHVCLGQFIARAQISEGLHLIAKRLVNPKQTGENGWRPFFGVWGVKGLPIAFEQGPRA